MPKFKVKGLPNFTKIIQAGNGATFDRTADLVCHLRADPNGRFTDLAGNLLVSPLGDLKGTVFKHGNRETGPAAFFGGQNTAQGLTGSVDFTVPATGSHFFTNTAGSAVSGNYDSSGSGIRAGQGPNQYTSGSLGNHLVYPYETYFHTVDGGQSVGFDLSDELTIVDGTPITEMHLYFQAKFDSDLDAETDVAKISWMSGSSWSNMFVTASSGGGLYKDNTSGGWTKIKSVSAGSKFISFDPAESGTFLDNAALADDAWRWYKLELKNVEADVGSLGRFTFGLTAAAGEQFHISNPIIHSPNNDFGTETNNYLSLYPDDSANVCISGWINLESLPSGSPGGRTIISQTHKSGTDELYGTTVYINSNGQLGVRLHDRDNANIEKFYGKIVDINRKFNLNQWYHFTIIVNNTGLFIDSNDDDAFQVYINGEPVGLTSETGAGGEILKSKIRADGDRPISIGFGRGGYNASASPKVATDNYFHGSLAEIAIWRSLTPFNSSDATLIYRANKNLASGLIGLSAQALIQEKSINTVRPPNLRSTDQRRLGNNQIFYDDARASVSNPGSIQLPAVLHHSDPLLNSIYNGYFDGQLTVPSTGSSLIYQDLYTRQDDIQHKGKVDAELGYSPFEESRILINSGTNFYDTGTSNSVLQGFDQPLRNKQQVAFVIDLKNDAVLGHAGGTTQISSSVPPQPYMRYINFATNTLDQKGGIASVEGAHISATDGEGPPARARFFQSSSIGFGPMPGDRFAMMCLHNTASVNSGPHTAGHEGTALYRQDQIYKFLSGSQSGLHFVGRPTDAFGFPSQEIFASTDGQTLDCSTIISKPFLVEKITVDLDYEWMMSIALTATQFSTNATTPPGPPHGYPSSRSHKFQDPTISGNAAQFYASQLTSFVLRETSEPVNETFAGVFNFPTNNTKNINAIYRNELQLTGSFRELVGYGQATAVGATIPTELVGKTPRMAAIAGVQEGSRLDEQTLLDGGLGRETNVIFARQTTTFDPTSGGERAHATQSGHLSINYTPKPAVQTDLVGTFGISGAPYDGSAIVGGATAGIFNGFAIGYTGDNNRNNTSRNPSPRSFNAGTFGKIPPTDPKFIQDFPLRNGTNDDFSKFLAAAQNFEDLDRPTPYIITPNDKLIFGFQLDPPTDFANQNAVSTGNKIIIKGPIRIQLFGSYIENSRPKWPELNQLLTNDVVFESIGDEIYDQFDFEPPEAFSGSYSDNYISGSNLISKEGVSQFYFGYNPETLQNEYLARRATHYHSSGAINPNERVAEVLHAKAVLTVNGSNLSNAQTVSITFGAGATPQVITMNSGAGTDSTSFAGNAAALYLDNNANAFATAASIATLANSVSGYSATSTGAFARAVITLAALPANGETLSITFGNANTPQVITFNSGGTAADTTFSTNAADLYIANASTDTVNEMATAVAVLANSVSGFTASATDAAITITADTAVKITNNLTVSHTLGAAPTVSITEGGPSTVTIIADVAVESTFDLTVTSNPTVGAGGALTSVTSNGGSNIPGIGIRGSLSRNIRLNEDKVILDTVPPDIYKIWKTDTVTSGDTTPTAEGLPRSNDSVVVFNDNEGATPNTYFIYTHLAKWPYAFPFEPRYQGIDRTSAMNSVDRRIRGRVSIGFQGGGICSSSAEAVSSGSNPPHYLTGSTTSWPADVIHYSGSAPVQMFGTKAAAFVQPSYLYYGFPEDIEFATIDTGVVIPNLVGDVEHRFFKADDSQKPPNMSRDDRKVRSILFGIGEANRGRFIARRREFGNDGFYEDQVGYDVNIRGFKYGLMNANPASPSCVFRRDSYGQFRDLLEMAGNYVHQIEGTQIPTVEARFFTPDGVIETDRARTTCSNLSTFVTSSAPYFDRDQNSDDLNDVTVIRNRIPIAREILDVEIEF